MISKGFIAGTVFGFSFSLVILGTALYPWQQATNIPQHHVIHHVKVARKISLDTDHGIFEIDAKTSDDPLEDSTELNPVPLDKRKKKQKGMKYKKGHVPEDDVSDDMPSMLPVIYLSPSTPNELQAVHEPKHGKVNVQEAVAEVDTDAGWSNTPLRYLRPSGHDQTEPIDEVIEEERAAPSSKKDKKKSKIEKMRMSTEVPVDYGSMQIKVIRTVRGDWGEEK